MRVKIDRFAGMVDEAALKLPDGIFAELNLGISILEEFKVNPNTGSGQLAYILAEYRFSQALGRGIVFFYGSFEKVYPDLGDDAQGAEIILSILKHELTHHLESQAGARDLEIADAWRLLEL